MLDDKNIKNIAVFPISIPLIVGPSALTLSVLISDTFSYSFLDFYTLVLPMLLILALTSFMIFFSSYILKILNEMIIKILKKIFGIILGALSIEFIVTGIKGVIWPKLNHLVLVCEIDKKDYFVLDASDQ